MPNPQWQRWRGKENLFWSKVQKGKSNECWNWLASTNKDGYGQFWIGDTFLPSHVVAWILTRKCDVPEGLQINHHCDNRSCCNPGHTYAGTQLDNAHDRLLRSPKVPAYIIANPSLHEGEIWLIRKLRIPLWKGSKKTKYQFSQTIVSKMFKVHQTTIHHIWHSDKYLSKEGTYV